VGPVAADGIFMTENRAAKKAARARMACAVPELAQII
jgi:hypothetical protein